MKEIEYHPLAAQEYKEAITFYKERSIRAARNFQSLYEKTEDLLLGFPTSGVQTGYRDYRKYHLPDFPYSIIYRQNKNRLLILAVSHQSRHPNYWKERLRDIPE